MTLSACWPLGLYAASSPFYDRPLHLVDQQQAKIKPNIMLYIDNTGSMNTLDVIESPGLPAISRMQSVKNALTELLDPVKDEDKKMVEKFNWGISFLNNYAARHFYWAEKEVQTGWYDGYDNWGRRVRVPIYETVQELKAEITHVADDVQTAEYNNQHKEKLKAAIKEARALGSSPGGESYTRIVKNMINNIKYRCETNAIIMLSDGNINDIAFPNSSGPNMTYAGEGKPQHNAKWGFIDSTNYDPQTDTFRGDEDSFWRELETSGAPNENLYHTWKRQRLPSPTNPTQFSTQNVARVYPNNFDKPPISYWDWIVPQDGFKGAAAKYNNLTTYHRWTYPHPYDGGGGGGEMGAAVNYSKDKPIGNMIGPYGLAYMTYALSHNDLIKVKDGVGKTPGMLSNSTDTDNWTAEVTEYNVPGGWLANKGATDREGGSWDDPDWPPQTIETYTIAFGTGMNHIQLSQDLIEYASRYGNKDKLDKFIATNKADLLNAIKAVAGNSLDKMVFSVGLPSVTRDETGNLQMLSTTINTQNWSSQLRFLRSDNKGNVSNNKDKPIFDQPSYGTAQLESKSGNTRVTLVNKGGEVFDLASKYHTILSNDGDDLNDKSDPKAKQREGLAKWLLRQSNQTDSQIDQAYPQINLRDRCQEENPNQCKTNDPDRQMGDVLHMPVYSIDDGTREAKRRQSFVATAANDGMVHIFKDTEQVQPSNSDSSYHPYELKLNYIPGSIPRENAKDTVLDKIKETANPFYTEVAASHHSLINGGMSWMRLRTKNCTENSGITATSVASEQNCKRDLRSQVFLSTTLGQGGKGVFNLNLGGRSYKDLLANNTTPLLTGLSNPDMKTWQASVPLWESGSEYPAIRASQDGSLDNTNDDNKKKIGLGYVMGAPALGAIITKRKQANDNGLWLLPDLSSKRYYASFVANGYFSADQTPSLYIYNAMNFHTTENQDGSSTYHDDKKEPILIKKISVALTDIGTIIDKNGLSTPTAVDYDLDGVMDLVYAGDYNGNLYRFDLRAEDPSKWKASKIYAGSKDQPITAAPVIASLNPKLGKDSQIVVMFGTGSDIYDTDIDGPESKKIQSFYGIFDDPAKEIGTGDGKQPLVTYANRTTELLQQNVTTTGSENNSTTRYVSNKPITDKHQGWFIDLISNKEQKGERVTTKADFTSKTVFFTSREYNAKLNNDKICSAITSSASGYNYGLNVKTGGSLTRRTDRFNHLKTQINGDGLYASAYQISGALSPPRIVSRKNNSSMMHGIEGRNGDELGDDDARNFAVDCVPGSNLYVSSSESGLRDGITLICASNAVKRISWREIF